MVAEQPGQFGVGRHDAGVALGPVLELPPLSRDCRRRSTRCLRRGLRCAGAARPSPGRPAAPATAGCPRPRSGREDQIVLAEVDGFLGTEPGVVHDREEGDEPWPAGLLGTDRGQQCSRLAWVHDASPVHLAGYLGRCPFEYPDRVRFQQAEFDRVVHGVGQDGAVPPGGARSGDLAIYGARGQIEHSSGHRGFGQRRDWSAAAAHPGQNLGHIARAGPARCLVLNPHRTSARRMLASFGRPRASASIAGVAAVRARAMSLRYLAEACFHFMST